MLKRFCDICGKEIKEHNFIVTATYKANWTNEYGEMSEEYEVCDECKQSFENSLKERKEKGNG